MGQDGAPRGASAPRSTLSGRADSRYPRDELLALLRDVDSQLRRLAAVDAQLICEIDQRHSAANSAPPTRGAARRLRASPAKPPPAPRRPRPGAAARADRRSAAAIFPRWRPRCRRRAQPGARRPTGTPLTPSGRGRTGRAGPRRTPGPAGRSHWWPKRPGWTPGNGHLATRLLAHLDRRRRPGRGASPRRRGWRCTPVPTAPAARGELSPETVAVWRTVLDALFRPAPQAEAIPTRAAAGSAPRRATRRRQRLHARATCRRRRHPGHPAHHPHRPATGHRPRVRGHRTR